jgi:hypothetical protein
MAITLQQFIRAVTDTHAAARIKDAAIRTFETVWGTNPSEIPFVVHSGNPNELDFRGSGSRLEASIRIETTEYPLPQHLTLSQQQLDKEILNAGSAPVSTNMLSVEQQLWGTDLMLGARAFGATGHPAGVTLDVYGGHLQAAVSIVPAH